MSDYQIPNRNFARQVRTVVAWALIPIILVAVPLTWTLIAVLDTNDDTQAIRFTQDQADRNLAVQACTTRYAATAVVWEDRADSAEALIIQAAVEDRSVDPALARRSVRATANAEEMNRRRLGLSQLAEEEAGDRSNGFGCPPIPHRLRVEPLDPLAIRSQR